MNHETAPLHLDVASALSIGARERQEDALAVAFADGTELGFAVLSDGMGGHAAGDLASRIIVSEVFAELTLRSRDLSNLETDLPLLLRHAVNVANESLRAHVEASPNRKGMGGTIVVTAVLGDRLYWISVGDSALYILRKGRIERLNAVHSMASQMELMVEKGLMDPETADAHPHRNCLTSAVMGEDLEEVDCPDAPVMLRPGDRILVASDGLDALTAPAITEIAENPDHRGSREIAQALIAGVEAVGDPSQDNTSLIVLSAGLPEARPAPEVQPARRTPLARLFGWLRPARLAGGSTP